MNVEELRKKLFDMQDMGYRDFQSGLILYAFNQGNGLFFLLAGGRKNYRRNKPKRQHRLVFP